MRFLLASIACLFSLSIGAQEVSHAFTLGVGLTNVFDSYLSPLEYAGKELRLQRETLRPTQICNGNVTVQTILNAHASYGENQSGNGKMYEGLLNWNVAWLYKWDINSRFTVLAGPMLDLNGGVIYNKRNSNNPAQAKVYANADVSAMAYYHFKLFHRPFRLRYQLAVPVVGVMFSPEYGESYYEMFELGHGGWHNVCPTTPFSQPSLRHSLFLDFTLINTNLRIGYVGDIQQSAIKQLHSHTYSHALMVGVIKDFQISKKPIQ